MTSVSYREKIARYVLGYLVDHDNRPVLAADMYRDLFVKYPKVVNFRMVAHVLRNKVVFVEVVELERNRYSRIYKIRDTVYGLTLDEMLKLLLR